MDGSMCVFLGIKVKPGPIERHKLENFSLDNTVGLLRSEAEKKANVPSTSLELIHHGKILKDDATLLDSGVKNGEMVHVVKRKFQAAPPPPPSYSDSELQQLNTSLRTLGCTPNAPGWTRAMQLLNDENAMAEISESVPSLVEDCSTLSILHEVELLAALGANVQTMRRGANAHPGLPNALRTLMRLVRSSSSASGTIDGSVPTSGFAYSLEALSEDEDADEEETEEGAAERNPITQEQLAAALQAATEAVSGSRSGAGGQDSLLRLLAAADDSTRSTEASTPTTTGASRSMITPEMFSEAISEAITRAGSTRNSTSASTPMDQGSASAGSSSTLISREEDFAPQLQHMHEMGLVDDALNVRALLICSGDVNAAINLVFSGAIGDD
ncbi:ubiquitin-like protein 7 isoform X1 [Ostrinia nubilalis]|uniref:ubiquitin-like protein 7 isoform X1 n=1 Tax=Ostrinia nubilalis TaxID=29057 RepID=UPI00308220AB